MSAQSWRLARFAVLALVVAIVGLVGVTGTQTAKAAPPGAATNLRIFDQDCLADGRVNVSFVWSPSLQGTQWFDITRDPTFNRFGNQGPFPANANFTNWFLEDNTTYFWRVTTFTAVGPRTSDIAVFQTQPCPGAFSPPHSISSQVFSNFVRVNWARGNNNLFFCVDTAFSQSDLVNVRGSFHNWGCGTTATSLDLTGLACGTTHWWRVWAAGPGTSGYSGIGTFVSQPCAFSAPSNPDASVRNDGSVRITWTPGQNNVFSCVDLARSQADLVNFGPSWSNRCGGTGSQLVTGLQCGTTYWYRIWATGAGQTGYSPIRNFTTAGCAFQPPTDLQSNVVGVGGNNTITFDWEPSVPGADYYCVDYARTQNDLLTFTGTWANTCVLSPMTEAQVEDLVADNTWYWRVFAFAGGPSGYSDVEVFSVPLP